MQAVDILRHDGEQLAARLPFGQLPVRRVGLRAAYQHFIAVKAVEFRRIAHKKVMAQDFLRRPGVFLIVQPVHASEIRYARFRTYPGAAEKNDALCLTHPLLESIHRRSAHASSPPK